MAAFLASTLGVLGFALSINNWWRLRPDVYLVVTPLMYQAVITRKMLPLTATVEIHNAGTMGITLSAMEILPGTVADKGHFPTTVLTERYLKGPEFPVRIEARDSKVWTVNLQPLRQIHPGESRDWVVVARWYGRRRLLRKPGTSERDRRVRLVRAEMKLDENIVRAYPEGWFTSDWEGKELPPWS